MSIHLSPKHGLNPSMEQCFFCMKESGKILLPGRLPNDAEAPRLVCFGPQSRCDECAKLMEQGVILISAEPLCADPKNPYRTGGWVVLKDEAIERLVKPELAQQILKARFAFVPDETWDHIGLPR